MGFRTSMTAAHALCLSLLPLAARGEAGDPEIPEVTISRGEPGAREVDGGLSYQGKAFSGLVVERAGERLLSRTPYLDGKEHGVAEAFYPEGGLRFRKLFQRGRREGTHRGFWRSGALQFVRHYEHDLLEGEQEVFFEDGARAEIRHYRKGREEGQQRFYDRKGALVSNYTFKNGRRYGLVGRFDCISVVRE
jgi:antitoxin component YwqK of YwqJK toxin-antitoxin module